MNVLKKQIIMKNVSAADMKDVNYKLLNLLLKSIIEQQ